MTKTQSTRDITQSAAHRIRSQMTCRRTGGRSIRYGPANRAAVRASSSASNFSTRTDSRAPEGALLAGCRAVDSVDLEGGLCSPSTSRESDRGRIVKIARIGLMARIEVVGVFRIESLYFFAGPAAAGRRDPEESRP